MEHASTPILNPGSKKRPSQRILGARIRNGLERCSISIVANAFDSCLEQFAVGSIQYCDARSIAKFLVLIEAESITDDQAESTIQWLSRFSHAPSQELYKLLIDLPRDWLNHFVTPIANELKQSLNGLDPYERLSEILKPEDRKARGAYFTPRNLADAMVEQVEQELDVMFGLKDGINSTILRSQLLGDNNPTPFIRILDPAAGCGVFLVSCFERYKTKSDCPKSQANFLRRLFGFELCPVASAISNFRLACAASLETLDELAAPLQLFNLDTLSLVEQAENPIEPKTIAVETTFDLKNSDPFSICIGNPPFGSLTKSTHPSMALLLHGKSKTPHGNKSYFETDTGKIESRKTWLHDLYVQFYRLAHWLVDNSEAGILCFLSNANFLDNISFSGMRFQLLQSFDKINIRTPAELLESDTSKSFPITIPVTIAQFTRRPKAESVGCGEVTRNGKSFKPESPNYFFVAPKRQTTFRNGLSITELMPLRSSAIVTARDWLTIGFTRQELHQRISRLADPNIDEREFRELATTRTRSTRYVPGDSRGWKLTAARDALANDGSWSDTLVPIWYRAMDRRWIALHKDLVDWPRFKVSETLLPNYNLALVTRKQMVAGRPANYFWVVDSPAIDGIIRSDNRGNEFVFPLFKNQPSAGASSQFEEAWLHSNFDATSNVINRLKDQEFTPHDVLAMIYAQFSSNEYQTRFADDLLHSFPRVFLPNSRDQCQTLCKLGTSLINQHLLKFDQSGPNNNHVQSQVVSDAAIVNTGVQIDRKPTWSDGEIRVGSRTIADNVSELTWRFSAGAHQIAHKWLKDRRGRSLHAEDLKTYQTILGSVEISLQLVEQIDSCIAEMDLFRSSKSNTAKRHSVDN